MSDLNQWPIDEPIPLVPAKPRRAKIHMRVPGDPVALCGFVFTPANRCGMAEAIAQTAPHCAACEVEYLHIMWLVE